MHAAFRVGQGEPGLVAIVALAQPDIALHHLEAVLDPVVKLPHQETIVVEGCLEAPLPDLLLVDHRVEGLGDAAHVARHVVGERGPCTLRRGAGARRRLDAAEPACAMPVDGPQIDEAQQRQRGERREQQHGELDPRRLFARIVEGRDDVEGRLRDLAGGIGAVLPVPARRTPALEPLGKMSFPRQP